MGDYFVKRIILPGGHIVEVTYFAHPGSGKPKPVRHEALDSPPDALEVCPECGSDSVYPIDWHESSTNGLWHLKRICGQCRWARGDDYPQEQVERYDNTLNAHTDKLIEGLEALRRENLEGEIDRFVEALSGDHILPFDF